MEDEECNYKIVNAIYVNSQKALTTVKSRHSNFYLKIEIKEHYIIIEEPGELYLTNFSVEEGKGGTIAKAIYKA